MIIVSELFPCCLTVDHHNRSCYQRSPCIGRSEKTIQDSEAFLTPRRG
jgi:hypothetical protein